MRFRHRFEAFLGSFITWIYIRMILARQTPVSLLDLLGFGVALDAEGLVGIAAARRHLRKPVLRKRYLGARKAVGGMGRDAGNT